MTKNFQAGIVVGVCALLLVSAVAIGQETATDSAATVDEAVVVAQDSAETDSKKAPKLVGTYSCVGDIAVGEGEYTGYVKITAHGDAYKVQWKVSEDSFEGIGIVVGQTLSVGWVNDSGQQGIAVYKVPKGKQPLVGRWTGLDGDGEVANETLTKIKPGDEKQAVSWTTKSRTTKSRIWSFFE